MRTCTIHLTSEERQHLEQFVHRGKANARTLTRVRILLRTDDGWSIAAITQALDVSAATVSNTRQRYLAGGVDAVLQDKKQAQRRRALSGEGEALLVAITCSAVPAGHDHWTLRMLSDKLVELDVVDQIDHTTVGRLLKKMTSSRGNGPSGASASWMPRS